jgi:diguanylate cyclase (GGDEF)-like protein
MLRIDTSLGDMRSILWFLVVGVGIAPLVSGLLGVGMRVWAGANPASDYFDQVRTWWVGDAIGIASVTPAVLTIGAAWLAGARPRVGRLDRFRDRIQALVVLGSPFLLYALQGEQHRLLFISAFPVIWVAVTRGFMITSVTVLYTNAACTLAASWQGLGGLDLTDVQTFMLTLAVASLAVAAYTRELRRSRAELAHQAAHDFLTGLPNRRTFFFRLSDAVAAGGELSVVFFSLDRLKIVGDSLGLEIMDRLLVQVGERVAGAVGAGCFICRYGGDEFAVLLVETSKAGARLYADRIRYVLSSYQFAHRRRVTASFGIASLPEDVAPTADDLIQAADEALYAAKRAGKNRVSVHEDVVVAQPVASEIKVE